MHEGTRYTRCLFVVSDAFGELSSALAFAEGLSADSLVLLPERLMRLVGPDVSIPRQLFASSADVMHVFEEYRPQAVFLFSGYLLVSDKLFSTQALTAFVQRVEEIGARLVTSDPLFIGITPFEPTALAEWLPNRTSLQHALGHSARTLEQSIHLYKTTSAASAREKVVCAFNPITVAASDTRNRLFSNTASALDPDKKRWLFIMSQADFACEAGSYGRNKNERLGSEEFFSLLRARIRDAIDQGRQPVFIGPQRCVENLQDLSVSGARLMPFCEFSLFHTILLEAEHVFYWNIFSDSIVQRIAHGRPLHLFGLGHMVDGLRGMHERGLAYWYNNAPLPFIDPRERLATQALEASARRQLIDFAVARENVLNALRPQDAVDSLL